MCPPLAAVILTLFIQLTFQQMDHHRYVAHSNSIPFKRHTSGYLVLRALSDLTEHKSVPAKLRGKEVRGITIFC